MGSDRQPFGVFNTFVLPLPLLEVVVIDHGEQLKGTSKNCPSRPCKPQASQRLQGFSRYVTHEIRDFSRCPELNPFGVGHLIPHYQQSCPPCLTDPSGGPTMNDEIAL